MFQGRLGRTTTYPIVALYKGVEGKAEGQTRIPVHPCMRVVANGYYYEGKTTAEVYNEKSRSQKGKVLLDAMTLSFKFDLGSDDSTI